MIISRGNKNRSCIPESEPKNRGVNIIKINHGQDIAKKPDSNCKIQPKENSI